MTKKYFKFDPFIETKYIIKYHKFILTFYKENVIHSKVVLRAKAIGSYY